MLASVIAWLVSKGLPQKYVKPLLGLVAVTALIAGLALYKTHYDSSVVTQAVEKANVVQLQKEEKSNDAAAEARATDTIIIYKKQEERTNAIAKATDDSPTAADVALNCQRLQQAGYDISVFPSCS